MTNGSSIIYKYPFSVPLCSILPSSSYHDYFWPRVMGVSETEVNNLIQIFIRLLTQNKNDIYKTCCDIESLLSWNEDTALLFFRFLLARKEILFNINKELNFSKMKIWLPEERDINEFSVLG